MKQVSVRILLTVLLAVTLSFAAAADCFAAETIAKGFCGENITWNVDSNGKLTLSGTGAMFDYSETQNLVYIDSRAIQSIVIGNGVANIGSHAFFRYVNLRAMRIAKSVAKIGDHAFAGCTGLTDVILPEGVTDIGEYAFAGCTGLTVLKIPAVVSVIRDGAFSECGSLAEIYYYGSPEEWAAVEIGPGNEALQNAEIHFFENMHAAGYCGENLFWTLDNDGVLTVSGTGEMYDFDSASSEHPYPWTGLTSSVKTLVLEPGVTSIGAYAFSGCTQMTSAVLPASLTVIGTYAFSRYGSSLTDIYYDAPAEQWNPDGRMNTGSALMNVCFHTTGPDAPIVLNRGRCGKHITWAHDNRWVLTISGTGAMYNYDVEDDITTAPWGEELRFRSVIIQNGVTRIGSYAFFWTGVRHIAIPVSVTSVGSGAFGEDSLSDVYYAGTKEQWLAVSGRKNVTNGGSGNPVAIHLASDGIFTVSYDANGGVGAPAAQEKTAGVDLTLSEQQPTRADAAGKFIVCLDSNDGSGSVTLLETNGTSSYAFRCWNTAADGSGADYAPGAVCRVNEDLTLCARWNVSVRADPVALPTPARNGYFFLGWGTAKDAKSGVVGSYTPTENVTLYAIWLAPDLVLPEALRVVGNESFAGGAFTFVMLSEQTVTISSRAFADCPSLAFIYIPKTAVKIDPLAFDGVRDLTILGASSSLAEAFAKQHGYAFINCPPQPLIQRG